MSGRVPLARRNLLAERRRFTMSLLGVGAAIALILLLQGLWSGTRLQISAYQDNVGAELYVGQRGTRNFGADNSQVPETLGRRIQQIDGVTQTAPVIARYVILDMNGRKQATTLVGYEPGAMGGPWSLSEGRSIRSNDEIAIDEVMAEQHGLSLGGGIEVMGAELRIVGLVSGARTWMTGMAFVSIDTVQALQRTPGVASFILVDTDRPAEVQEAIMRGFDVAVLDASELAENEHRLFSDIIEAPLDLMIAIAFAAGTMIVALTVYSSIAERIREYGIVKAVGARFTDLLRTVVGQTLLIALAGTVSGFLIYVAGSRVIEELRPQFWTRVTPLTAVVVVGSALFMALLAAVVPTRRLSRLDPASVYRG
jgi:putative ABC transport system permease protein